MSGGSLKSLKSGISYKTFPESLVSGFLRDTGGGGLLESCELFAHSVLILNKSGDICGGLLCGGFHACDLGPYICDALNDVIESLLFHF